MLGVAASKEHLQAWHDTDPILKRSYEWPSKKFEKMKYRRYCKQKWSDAKLVAEIKQKFLSDEQRQVLKAITDEKERRDKILIVFGNWCRSTQMKGCDPSPGKGLRRMLSKHFRIYTINEAYTSKLYHVTHQPLSRVYKRVEGKPAPQLVHEVLTCQRDPHHCIFVNRDVNANRNIHFLTMCWISGQRRPDPFNKPS
jgi:hypothetical protein